MTVLSSLGMANPVRFRLVEQRNVIPRPAHQRLTTTPAHRQEPRPYMGKSPLHASHSLRRTIPARSLSVIDRIGRFSGFRKGSLRKDLHLGNHSGRS
jgi:hypothetical protein